jgi:tRNA-splicing ligase RtcB (3'-phosphate/5'-hydroxy nucleic acid ligase)
MSDVRRISEVEWELRPTGEMRVPGRVFADVELMDAIGEDGSLEQLRNVATLPGVVDAVLAMPDVHQGYGFPVGGVAATELPDGVVSPGGVGFDVNCGVRLLAAPFTVDELGGRREALVHEISRAVPAGTGRGSGLELTGSQLDHVLRDGPRALGEEIARPEDVELTESQGRLDGADPAAVSDRARERGSDQLGTLGSGNHFLELQRVDRIHDDAAADALGLRDGQVTILIHSGSRGLGHQVCTDFVKRYTSALGRHGIHLPDRQLACAPASSDDGRSYLAAMAAAANFAWANRQLLAHRVREAIERVLGQEAAAGTSQVYDVAHNVAKVERHGDRDLCVHRKGATRAFPPGSAEIPGRYRDAGQPVFIPGSMGTASYVLAGRAGAMERSFGTVCHGAGRRLSRTAARKRVKGGELRRQLEEQGITVRSPSNRGLAEEAPFAYKEVEKVVDVVERAGLAVRVARLRPVGVVKG